MRLLPRVLCAHLFLVLAATGSEPVVVVLAFHNQGEPGNLGWIGEAISETVREALFAEGVLALDRDSRNEAFRRLSLRPEAELTKASALRIAETLDAGAVVIGSFEAIEGDRVQSGAAVTIRGQVLDRLNLKESLVFTLTGKLENLHALQSRLAWQLLQFLVSDVPPEEEYWQRRRAVRTDAMENYILGLQAGDIDKKFRLLTAAAHLDHWFAAPSLQLGKMNWERKEYSSASEWLVRVGAGDPGFNEAQFLLGLSQYHLGEFEKASEAFRRVAASIPLGEVWNNLGAAQSRLNLPEALESFRHAQEGDPLDPVYNFNTGYALWKNRDFEEAADRFRAVLSAIPEDMAATSMLGRCLQRASPGRTAMPVQPLERLKFNFDEMAYRQLKAALSGASKSGRDR